uniref:Putative collagen alpha-1iii chain isoform x2 n=1 Tax=Lutzomyia longipalpis TaxID=7200 RepID=A0A1B0CNL2_LUTLO
MDKPEEMENSGSHPPMRGGGFRGRGPYRGFDPRGRGRGRGFGRGGPMGGRGMPPMMRGRGMMRSPRGFGMRGFAPRAPRGLGRGPPPSTTPTSSAPAATPEDGAPITTTTSSSAPRGSFRGRGFFRGRGSFGGPGAPNNTTIPGTGPDPKPFRGNDRGSGGFRGRGRGFGGFSRPFNRNLLTPGQDNGNIAPVPSLKRNGPGGLPGPKRGHYDSGPQRGDSLPNPTTHSGYVQDGSHQQSMDPYAQSYQQAPQQSYTNNGYSQTGYTDPNAQTTTYPQTSGYEQQYQDYSSATTYGTQDTRYQYNNTQSYQSGYGTTTDTYNTAPQDPYQQSSYDESTYSTGYDANAYSQGSYQNTTGYY